MATTSTQSPHASGKAHDLLLNWSEQGNDLKTIFFNLSLQFDRRMTADEARQKLLKILARFAQNHVDVRSVHLYRLHAKYATHTLP